MKKIKVTNHYDIPDNFTGCAELPNGTKYWYINGELHREEGPCTMCKDCLKGNFELCSKPGPAVIFPDGEEQWYLNGSLHREDGPAVVFSNGDKFWYLNGKRHREDGPAVVFPDGHKEWWLNGKPINILTFELYYMLKYGKLYDNT